jgi:hypothetical protein
MFEPDQLDTCLKLKKNAAVSIVKGARPARLSRWRASSARHAPLSMLLVRKSIEIQVMTAVFLKM